MPRRLIAADIELHFSPTQDDYARINYYANEQSCWHSDFGRSAIRPGSFIHTPASDDTTFLANQAIRRHGRRDFYTRRQSEGAEISSWLSYGNMLFMMSQAVIDIIRLALHHRPRRRDHDFTSRESDGRRWEMLT